MSADNQQHKHHYETHHRGTTHVAYGGLIGITADGVPVMSNGDEEYFSNEASLTPGLQALSSYEKNRPVNSPYAKLGYQWQCVEFVRRYMAARKAIWLKSTPTAEDIWHVEAPFTSLSDGSAVASVRMSDGEARQPPVVGDIVVWGRSEEVPYGHVAVVTDVLPDRIRVAEQNQGFEKWPAEANYSREIPLERGPNGLVRLLDEDPVLGWISVQAPPYSFTEGNAPDMFRLIVSDGNIVRQAVAPQVTLPWLQPSDECDFFLQRSLLGEGGAADLHDVPGAFYYIDYDMWCRIGRAARSLHQLALAATEVVLNDPDSANILEHYFGVAPAIQPLLRRSWELTPPMEGRFDFGFDGQQIVMLEYNCDSSGALLECCSTQEKMAQYYGIEQGQSTGSFLGAKCVDYFAQLAKNERACPKHHLIHFMIDDDDEERYTALCMMKFAEQAGFRTKLCVKLTDFVYRDGSPVNAAPAASRCDHPTILDLEHEEVLLVWKSWSWDTILHQYADQQCHDHGDRTTPSLSDILLNDNIRVLEPLWKAITGSKAILPFMHVLAPDHQNMLPAAFTLTKEIISKHYLSKPVNGRAGQNVVMYDPIQDEAALKGAPEIDYSEPISPKLKSDMASFGGNSVDCENESSPGKFFDSVLVYQQRIFLKKFDHKYFPIFCGWMIGDEFSGVVVREDTSKITKLASVVVPARVVRENVPLGENPFTCAEEET